MKIAVIGSGGREHAILWRLSRDPETHTLYALPGNGGTGALAESVAVDAGNVAQLRAALRGLKPDLVVVGPEVPLAAGIADALLEDHLACFGPVAKAARVESSKAFSKRLMRACDIPTAEFEIFTDYDALETYVRRTPEGNGWVVKADGLAAGKGAFVCASLDEVLATSHGLLVEKRLGAAGQTIVLERKLQGREVSALYLCDGERYRLLPPAQDYKRALDGDAGPNTGGMGTYCPAPHLTPELAADIGRRVVMPTMQALAEQDAPYHGVLYVGLMLTTTGPQVIEFNCRFGDPETQVILPVLEGNFAATLLACAEGRLSQTAELSIHGAAVCVVLAADEYPDDYKKEIPLVSVPDREQAVTFHAGTTRMSNRLVSCGGRVLNAVGMGATMTDARASAYALAAQLRVEGLRYRVDIAERV